MKEQLIHILDQSVCLSRKQMKEYLHGSMLPEEIHAAEVHLSSCPLCSLAMEGFEEHTEQALMAIASLNSGFLKDHFDNISPQIHLNSMAPVTALPNAHSSRRRMPMQPFWRVTSVAAAALLVFGLLWAMEQRRNREGNIPPRMINSGGGSTNNAGNSTPHTANSTPVSSASTLNQPVVVEHNQASPAPEQPQNEAATIPVKISTDTQDKGIVGLTVASRKLPTPAAASAMPTTVANVTPPVRKVYRDFTPEEPAEDNKGNDKKEAAGSSGTNAASPKPTTTSTTSDPVDESVRGNESYAKGSLGAALEKNKRLMTSTDPVVRSNAMLMAAKTYIDLGDKEHAVELLKQVIDGGTGSDRREAKKTLRKLK